jgi:hypothetical protein
MNEGQQTIAGLQPTAACAMCGCSHEIVRYGRLRFVFHRSGVAEIVGQLAYPYAARRYA